MFSRLLKNLHKISWLHARNKLYVCSISSAKQLLKNECDVLSLNKCKEVFVPKKLLSVRYFGQMRSFRSNKTRNKLEGIHVHVVIRNYALFLIGIWCPAEAIILLRVKDNINILSKHYEIRKKVKCSYQYRHIQKRELHIKPNSKNVERKRQQGFLLILCGVFFETDRNNLNPSLFYSTSVCVFYMWLFMIWFFNFVY
jgi:hypothetical protein